MKSKKKVLALFLAAVMSASLLAGCGNGEGSGEGNGEESSFDTSQAISVVSREEGSGTRGAFTELFGVVDDDDKK